MQVFRKKEMVPVAQFSLAEVAQFSLALKQKTVIFNQKHGRSMIVVPNTFDKSLRDKVKEDKYENFNNWCNARNWESIA